MLQHRRQRGRAVAIGIVLAVSLAAGSCSGDDSGSSPSTSGAGTSSPAGTTTAPSTSPPTTRPAATTTSTTSTAPGVLPGETIRPTGLRLLPAFAEYRWVPPLGPDAVYGFPATPTSFDDVLLTPHQQQFVRNNTALVAALETNGFAIDGAYGNRFFHDGYKSSAYWERPIYVTTDSIYETWHLVFDRVLRDTEQQRLLPTLERFVTRAVDVARTQEADLERTALADRAHRTTAFFEAAATLLRLDVGAVNDLARQEVALIGEAAGVRSSPITGTGRCEWPDSFVGCIDYSLFRPRGHYTRTADLERYFQAMSVLGQEGFELADGVGVVPGLLVSRVILGDAALLADWKALYEPTAFLVGLADDIDPFQLVSAADDAIPGWIDDPTLLIDADMSAIADAVLAAHPVAIDPDRASVRVMGARFTLDALILDQLAWPNVGTDDLRRVRVSGLDVAAAFGSPLARRLQLATQSEYVHYGDQLDAMTELVASRRPDDWAGTVYDAWLVAIAPQFTPRGQAYPDYMRSDAWAAKALQTGLASYTELKHDTVLYTKQATAGEGDGPEPATFEPRQWVEPDPVAFGRIAAAGQLLRDGFTDRDLLTPETDDLLATLIELSDWLGAIAGRELEGTVASDAEDERLRGIGSELEYLWIAASEIELDQAGFAVPDWTERAALVTDVFTTSFSYLQLGTGGVDIVHVIVPLGDGRFELAEGQVFSYYEFWRSNSEPRLTDEEWRQLVSDGNTPPRPAWMAPAIIGVDIAPGPVVEF